MKKSSRTNENPRFGKKGQRFSLSFSLFLTVAILATAVVTTAFFYNAASTSVTASPAPAPTPPGQKHYVGTKRIVKDSQTGEIRTPTQPEVDELVSQLTTLAKRTTDDLQQTAAANGAVGLDLAGGFGGVMLGRPNGDGTFETRCVFTFEEGAEFLGLVEVDETE
jgi:hypothetical protein